MPRFIVRVWLADRPGALGAVASRIGSVRGDLVSLEILERNAGVAVDEFTVDLPESSLVDLLVSEISQVDGVEVEDVRQAPLWLRDPRLAPLESAAIFAEQTTVEGLCRSVVERVMHDFGGEWVSVVDLTAAVGIASAGKCPPSAWVAAFVLGVSASSGCRRALGGPQDDVAAAVFPQAGYGLALGRSVQAFRARELSQLAILTRVADARWRELSARHARKFHPTVAR